MMQQVSLILVKLMNATYCCEIEVAEGLELITRDELYKCVDERPIHRFAKNKGALQLDYSGDLAHLGKLQTAIAAYLVLHYDVPRPRALLGHEHFQRLMQTIDLVFDLHERSAFETFHISAAGSNSSIMSRLKHEIATYAGLTVDDDGGDLLLRMRRAKSGWEVLVRLSPRPLVTRDWRVCNMEGALNAAVASAMVSLTSPKATDIVLNLGCGSGTLMIERLAHSKAQQVIGCDNDSTALDCARRNLDAAGYRSSADLIYGDIRWLQFDDNFANVLLADLPFGQLVGSHEENIELYPLALAEAARVAQLGATFVVITHEVRLMEQTLEASPHWQVGKIIMTSLRGLHPRIYLLRKI
jgi:tRNA (guanine6-N2)-methyltransferase